MDFSNFLNSFTASTDVNLNDYANYTATSAIGSYDIRPQSYNSNKPYFNLDDNDVLRINRESTVIGNVTVVGNIYNTN